MTHRKAHAEHAPDKSDAHSIGDGSGDQLLIRGIVWWPFMGDAQLRTGSNISFQLPNCNGSSGSAATGT